MFCNVILINSIGDLWRSKYIMNYNFTWRQLPCGYACFLSWYSMQITIWSLTTWTPVTSRRSQLGHYIRKPNSEIWFLSFIFIFRISICPFSYLWHSFYNDVKICVTSYFIYEVSHEGKSCTKFLNQHNFICSKFYKLYKYNINIPHNKTTGLRNNFNN